MNQSFIVFILKWLRVLIIAIAIFFIICLATASVIIFVKAIDIILPGSASQVSQVSSNSPVTDAQAQQKFDQGTNDINVATNVITYSGVFIALTSIILALVGAFTAVAAYLRLHETRVIINLRSKLEKDIGDINDRANQTEKRIDESSQTFQNLLTSVTKNSKEIEERTEEHLRELAQRFERESQKFIEAAYNYSEGIKEYRRGDNNSAIRYYMEALRFQPNSPRILEKIGRAYSNLNEDANAVKYLKLALDVEPEYELAKRSLALYYRSSNTQEAIKLLRQIVQKNPVEYEAWDFLGLCYRDQLQSDQQLIKDQAIIEKAIEAHEEALKIKERPETQFYLGILLYYSPNGDKNRARKLLLSASANLSDQENDLRIRDVWKKLIIACVPIVNDDKEQALAQVRTLVPLIKTQRIYTGVVAHLLFLLNGTGHVDWVEEFMRIISVRKEAQNA